MSTVDGEAIAIAEVTSLVDAGLPAREALRRLQAERLLMEEAERRGLRDNADVERAAQQAAVQALLESEADAVQVSDDEIKAEYEKQRARFEKPERRASVHVLASLAKKATPADERAALAFATQALEELRAAKDLDAYLREKRTEKSSQFEVFAEKLPAVDAHASFAQPYLDGLFSIAAPGVVPKPVRSSFGWHAIRVTEIIPAETTPYETAATALRNELLEKRRSDRIKALIESLRIAYRAQVTPNAAAALARFEP